MCFSFSSQYIEHGHVCPVNVYGCSRVYFVHNTYMHLVILFVSYACLFMVVSCGQFSSFEKLHFCMQVHLPAFDII